MSREKTPRVPPRFVIRAALAARVALQRAIDAVVPPQLILLEHASAIVRSEMIHVAARMRIADKLAAGAKSPGELARECGANEDALRRTMRALAAFGVFARDADGRYRNNRVSRVMISGTPGGGPAFAEYFGAPYHARAWAEFAHTVATGESAFEHVYGKTFWEYCVANPEAGANFADAMRSGTQLEAPAVASGYPWGELGRVCDVAGGSGTLLSEILAQHPRVRGILFDEPYVIARAADVLGSRGVAARCETVAGNFFESVPAGADGYVLKDILHDWDDARSATILANVRRACEPGAKVLAVEVVVEEDSADPLSAVMDLQMLAVASGGRQRSAADFRALYSKCGFRLSRVVSLAGLASVVEGIAV